MRKLGPLMDPTIIDGGRVTLAGDVTGPSDNNVVERLTGAAGIVDLVSAKVIQQTQPAALPAEVIGIADLDDAALYGGGGTLNGTTLALSVNQQGTATLNLSGVGNAASKVALLNAINAKVAWLGITATQDGGGGLSLTADLSVFVDPASTSLTALDLASGIYSLTASQEVPIRVVPQSGQAPWEFILSTSPGFVSGEIDDTFGSGYNVFNQYNDKPGAGWVIEQFFNDNYEFYSQFHTTPNFAHPLRSYSVVYNWKTGANSSRIGSQVMSIGFVNGSGGVGNDTQQINFFAAAYDRQTATGVSIDIVSVLASTVALVDAGAALTNYAIRANVNGQIINLQANVNGSLAIDTTKIGFFGGSPVGIQTVAGVKVDAVAASILAALKAYNIVLDTTT